MEQTAQKALHAVADPMRQRILKLLSERSRSVHELAMELPVTRPNVSHHLRVLKDAQLVEVEKAGTRNIYKVGPSGAGTLQAFIESVWGDALSRFKLVADNFGKEASDDESTEGEE